jgi:Holliday junction DNA helicase RuvA
MIGHLTGRIVEIAPGGVVLDAGGVGYEISLPLSAAGRLAGKSEAALWVHTHVREDQLALYGFPSRRERDTFRLLIGVSGVGPRTALALLSALTPEDIAVALDAGEWRRLASAPGIGRRTAERLIVELKGKLVASEGGGDTRRADATSALVNLGFSVRSAEDTIVELLRDAPAIDLTELLRRALQKLTR